MSYRVRQLERVKFVINIFEADTVADLPPSTDANNGDKCITLDDGALYLRDGRQWVKVTAGAAGATAWGAITGTLANQTDLQSALDVKQPLDSDLTAVAALAPSNDDVIQRKAGAWTNRTMPQVKTDLVLVKSDVGLGNVDNTTDAGKPVSTATQTALDLKQPLDSDLTTIAGLTPTSDNFMVAAASAWASRTPAQAKTSLALAKADVGLGSVDNTSDAGKPVSTAQQTALDLKANLASPTFSGTVVLPAKTVTLAMQADMATASLVYRKTAGAGAPEINTLATVKTDLALVKADVGLGSVDNTADAAKAVLSATKLTTPRTIGGVSFDGSANITVASATAGFTVTGGETVLAAGTTTTSPLNFPAGTNETTPEIGDCEFDGVQFYKTIDLTSSRGAVPIQQYFHLTAAGATIGTIANYFGANSNISLIANAHYLIEIYCFFLNTTAGTLTWTFTNSAAPANQNICYEMSPLGGIVAPAGAAVANLSGAIYNDATAAKALTTSGTLTTAVNHFAKFTIFLINGTGTSLKIQATKLVGGTITPGIGSFWFARRLSPGNIGAFAA